MKTHKVVSVTSEGIRFDSGLFLSSHHNSDCCEHHELTFTDITLQDFDGLEFVIDAEGSFFRKVDGYGIEMIPVHGHSVRIPGHGYNNGYYGANLSLCVTGEGIDLDFDITECQLIEG